MCQYYVSITDAFYDTDTDTAANAANKKSRIRNKLTAWLFRHTLNEPASILLNSSLVAGVSCGDDLHGVKHESAPTSSQKGPTDDNGCTERKRGRIHLPTTAPHNEPPVRTQTHTDSNVWHTGQCSSSVHTEPSGATKQLKKPPLDC